MSPLIQEVEDDVQVPTTLGLTPVEATLRRMLLDVASYIDQSPPSSSAESQVSLPEELANENIILRFTGGWVRDKLLGVPSHDIDVAINKMTGYQFGLKLKEYLEHPGNPEKYGLDGVAKNDKQSQKAGTTDKSKTVGGLHKIEANPEKSKHLETVTTTILGLDIDLVNLRKETYTDDSRNPQMEFGTAEEDALRRDATVNAMFYNINTEKIEDYTNLGHQDMQKKIIRTPLEPYQTFRDDPLRVLRLIRFASRLGYRIEDEALKAMRNAEIKDALQRKISRERVGIEMEKCLRGPDPHMALQLVDDLDLYETIFCDPTNTEKLSFEPDTQGFGKSVNILQDELQDEASQIANLANGAEERFFAWHICALVPYCDAPQQEPSEPGRRAPPPAATQVAREGLKATNKVCDIVTSSIRNRADILALVDEIVSLNRTSTEEKGKLESERARIGMVIRHLGPSWQTQCLYAFLVATLETENADRVYSDFSTTIKRIFELNLSEAYNFKPLLDGKALAKALNTKPGPWMKDALDVVMAYQLRHPDQAKAEEAIEAVKAHQDQDCNGELTRALVSHFLKLTIRPSFAKAKPQSVTTEGRKNIKTVPPPKIGIQSASEAETKPWKSEKEAYVLDLLLWSLQNLSPATVEDVWPLVVPPLLTLLDDWESKYKTLGAELTHFLLAVTPPSLLTRTGLGQVFHDALFPCTTFIPPITPEHEALALQDATYPALLALHAARFPSTSTSTTDPTTASKGKEKSLTILLHRTITNLHALTPYAPLQTALLTHLTPLVDNLALATTPHLQTLVPVLKHLLCSTQTTLPTLLAATKALQAVVLNAWPRIAVAATGAGNGNRGQSGWWVEVLDAVCGAWGSVAGLEGGGVEEEIGVLKGELRQLVRLLEGLVVGVEGNGKWEEAVGVVERADGVFEGLFSAREGEGGGG
ncbi:hypothetical protein MBLNU230_g2313t1 [Neophaeotheca triangularis]